MIENNTGLKVNYEKTSLNRIGSLRDSDAELYTQKNFKWTSYPTNVLSVNIDHDVLAGAQNNYREILDKHKKY